MVCFCLRRNRVSPTAKEAELPDILAIPESSTIPEESAVTQHTESSVSSSEDPAVAQSSTAHADAAVSEDLAAVDNLACSAVSEDLAAVDNLACSAVSEDLAAVDNLACSAVSEESVSTETSVRADNVGITEETTAVACCDASAEDSAVLEELTQLEQDTEESSSASTDTANVTRRTFGRFDVYTTKRDEDCSDVTSTSERPLVILIPWLNAKRRHVLKYCSLYVDKGMDVLLMQLTPMQIIRPLRTKKIARQLLELLQVRDGDLAKRPLIIHGFSVGAFVWGQLLVEMSNASDCADDSTDDDHIRDDDGCEASSLTTIDISDNTENDKTTSDLDEQCLDCDAKDKAPENSSTSPPPKDDTTPQTRQKKDVTSSATNNSSKKDYSSVQRRIVGVVMDSPAPVDAMLKGIPSSISNNTVVRRGIKHLLASYFRLFPRSVARHYRQGEQAVEDNPTGYPVLIMYSSADVIVSSSSVDAVVAGWQQRGVQVHVTKWDDSPHVEHFRFHAEQYQQELQRFLDEVNPLPKEDPSSGSV